MSALDKHKMKLTAPAKINLYLRVKGRRPDGCHDIETIFLPVSPPSDEISLEPADREGIAVTSSDPDLPCGEPNICWKAAAAFAKYAGISPRWKIHIEKRIPVAAGLGGGSSDAAAVLKILQKINPGVDDRSLKDIASSVGADVPFFINPVPSLAMGKGEILEPLEFKVDIPVVIVNPLFPVSSAWAYKNLLRTGDETPKMADVIKALKTNEPESISKIIHNDLGPALYRKFPLLGILRDALLELGALAAEISGSGSSLFAVARSRPDAEGIKAGMGERFAEAVRCF